MCNLLWGQGFGPAAELQLGAELYVTAGDLVAGPHKKPRLQRSVTDAAYFGRCTGRRNLAASTAAFG